LIDFDLNGESSPGDFVLLAGDTFTHGSNTDAEALQFLKDHFVADDCLMV